MKINWEKVKNYCLHHIFEEQVIKNNQGIALTFNGKNLTYNDLNIKANQLAHYLQELDVKSEVMVGVYLQPSLETIISILAIIKAGGAYIPLDSNYPQERLNNIIKDTRISILITQSKFSQNLHFSETIICLDKSQEIIAQKSEFNPNSDVNPHNLLYVIYTSGSEGKPKGVMINHYNVVNLFEIVKTYFNFNENDIWTQFHSYSFGFSVWEIWGALLHGGKLVIIPNKITQSPEAFYDLIIQEKVTILSQTPTAFRLLTYMDKSREKQLFSLRYMIFSGEPLETYLLKSWFDKYGDNKPELINMYAITETSGEIAYHRLTKSDLIASKSSIIGFPLPSVDFYLLNEQMQPVSDGEIGEIYIGGNAVGRGYLNQPELTAEKFISNPFGQGKLYKTGDLGRYLSTGEIAFCGRIDKQIKIRGYRIELAEIEAKLAEYPLVKEAVVIVSENQENKQLIAYIIPEKNLTLQDLQKYLKGILPDYMIPNGYVFLDKLPLSPNGKLDIMALPIPNQNNIVIENNYIVPHTPLEKDLVKIWETILKIEKIGIDNNFFELGGDSIKGMQFSHRMQELWQDYVYITAIFEAPTIAELSTYLCEHYPNTVTRIYGKEMLRQHNIEPEQNLFSQPEKIDTAKVKQFRSLISPLSPEKQVTNNSKNPPMAFILSPPRSGSTLLRVMLAGHPKLFVPPELELLAFNTLQERKKTYSGADKFWLEGTIRAIMELQKCDDDDATQIMTNFEAQNLSTQEFYLQMQSWLEDRILVDKSTYYAIHSDVLEKAETNFESPYYIHLLRHPYGMINSYEEIKLKFFFRYPHSFSERQLAELIWLISQQNISNFLGKIPPQRQYLVKFEDLVKEPEKTLAGICQFLGISYIPEMANPYQYPENRMTNAINAHTVMLGDLKFAKHQKVDPQIAYRWQNNLKEDFLGEITWQMAEKFGYSRLETLDFLYSSSSEKSKSSIEILENEKIATLLKELDTISEEEAQKLLNQKITA